MAEAPGPGTRALRQAGGTGELRSWALSRLEQLVTMESPSGDRTRGGLVLDELERGYRRVGATTRRHGGDTSDHLVCRWSGPEGPVGPGGPGDTDGHVLLIGHCDTVFPAGTVASRPFRLADDGDTMTGPGVFDMKGSLVQVELAMRLLARAGLPVVREVRLVVVGDEEVGSPDGRRVVAAHAKGAAGVIGLEPPLPGGALKIGRRGVARYSVVVEGLEGHAGLDASRSVSAIDELVDQLAALRSLPAGPDHALNVGTIRGGTGANVVAGSAEAEIGLRFGTAEAERDLVEGVESLRPHRTGARVRVTRLSHRPAWSADPANPLAAELIALGRRLGVGLSLGTSGGAGDTNATGAAGIPTVDGLGPAGAGAHSPAEWASLASLLERAELLAAYLSGR